MNGIRRDVWNAGLLEYSGSGSGRPRVAARDCGNNVVALDQFLRNWHGFFRRCLVIVNHQFDYITINPTSRVDLFNSKLGTVQSGCSIRSCEPGQGNIKPNLDVISDA